MRVVFATEFFHPWQRGGAEVSTFQLAKGLAKEGVKIAIVTPSLGDESNVLDLPEDIKIHRFKPPLFRARGSNTPYYVFNHPLFFARFSNAIAESARLMNAKLIHACNYYSYISALNAARNLKLKVVATTRDYRLICPVAWCIVKNSSSTNCGLFRFYKCLREFWNLHEKGTIEAWHKFFIRHLYERALLPFHRRAFLKMDAVNFVSSAQMEIYRDFGLIHPNAEVLHNPVEPPNLGDIIADAKKFKSERNLQNKRIILFVGRFSIGKGAHILLEAYSKLRAKRQDVILVVLGSNEMGAKLGELKGAGVLMEGHVSGNDVLKWYVASDVVVVPSIWAEPYGRVVIEAQALGKPVVATNVGGTKEQIRDGVDGLLVPANDSDALASAITRILDDKKLAEKLGAEAKKLTQNRTLEITARRFLNWYQSVLEKD